MKLLRLTLAPLMIGLLSCTPASEEAGEGVAEPRALQGAVLFVLDTVRPDHLSVGGATRPTSPALQSLAEEGVLFEQVVSYAPWTLPSMAATLSGGSFSNGFNKRLKESVVESIREAGFRTAALTEGGWVASRFGFDLGFDSFDEEMGPVQLLGRGQSRNPNPPGGVESTFRKAMAWVTENQDEPFFLMIHTYEPHTPYTRTEYARDLPRGGLDEVFPIEDLRRVRSGELPIGEVERSYLEALYDGGIRETDRYLEKFLTHLKGLGLDDRTLIVVTSDHGEEFGEHYASRAGDHGHALYDEQILVPLVVYNPLETYPVSRVDVQVRTMDILPSIAELLGAAHETDRGGLSLLPMMRGESTEERIGHGGVVDAGPARGFVRYRGYKYIEVVGPERKGRPLTPTPPPIQLFDLASDPGESKNLAEDRPDLVESFHGLLERLLENANARAEGFDLPEDLDEATRARLKSLGYLD